MKTKKLLRKIKALLSADQRAQLAKYDSLIEVLGKLEAKEAALRGKLSGEEDEERQRDIHRKLKVLGAQREKGLKLKKEIEELQGTQ